MRRGSFQTRAVAGTEALVIVGDSSGTPSLNFSPPLMICTGNAALYADATGLVRRFKMHAPSVQSGTIAFFTCTPAGVIRDISADITTTTTVGINEYVIAPLTIQAGDTIGRWSSSAMSISYVTLTGTNIQHSGGTIVTKPTVGQNITASLTNTSTSRRPLLSATSF